MNPGAHITKIDLAGLRLARDVIRKHAALLDAACIDLGGADEPGHVGLMLECLAHVIDDDFRSSETPGGS
jgi:hypothetical protein